jgi:hypothetical protein
MEKGSWKGNHPSSMSKYALDLKLKLKGKTVVHGYYCRSKEINLKIKLQILAK